MKIVQLERENFFNKETVLRKKSNKVVDFGHDFQEELETFIKLFNSYEIAVGLSAPQVGILKRYAVINLNKGEDKEPLILINPTIVSNTSSLKTSKESCMSLPNYRGPVKRREKLSIDYQDRNGKSKNLNASGFLARVILHEMDHLNGVLFVDRMESADDLEILDKAWK